MQLNYVMAILDRDKRDQWTGILKSLNLQVSLTMLGHGTATREYLTLRGLSPTEKAIIATVADSERTKQLIRQTMLKMFLDIPGNGIMMAIPLKSVGGANTLSLLTDQQTPQPGRPDLKFDYELIYVILNEGYSDDVMDAARPAGARGGTVVTAKGTGIHQGQKFKGLTLASEKEIVLILAKASNKAEIMRAIMEKAGPESPAGAICFSLPVTQVAGLRMLEQDEEETTAE